MWTAGDMTKAGILREVDHPRQTVSLWIRNHLEGEGETVAVLSCYSSLPAQRRPGRLGTCHAGHVSRREAPSRQLQGRDSPAESKGEGWRTRGCGAGLRDRAPNDKGPDGAAHLMSLRARTTTNSARNIYPRTPSIITTYLQSPTGCNPSGVPPVNAVKLK